MIDSRDIYLPYNNLYVNTLHILHYLTLRNTICLAHLISCKL